EAVRRAAAMAGLKAERVLNEPTAAAMAYGLNRGMSRKVLVYDLGGGTFDATLLQKFEATNGVPFDGDQVALSRIADEAERAKIALSEREQVPVHLPML